MKNKQGTTLPTKVLELQWNTLLESPKRFLAIFYPLRCRKMSNVQALIAAAVVLHNIVILNMKKNNGKLIYRQKVKVGQFMQA
jgi:hypothetical protein